MKTANKLITFVFNAIVAVFCVLAIACYFFAPILDFKASVKMTPELAAELKKQLPEDDTSDSSAAGEVSEREVIEDVLDRIGEDEITLSVSVSATTADLLGGIGNAGKVKAAVEKVISDNVETLLGEMSESIDAVVDELSESMVRLSVKSALSDEINKYIDDKSLSDKTVDIILNELGFTDEYLDEKTDALLEALKAENASVDSVTETAVGIIDQAVKDIVSNAANGDYSDMNVSELSPTVKSEIEKSVRNILDDFADSDGNVNLDMIIYNTVGRMLDKDDESADTASIDAAVYDDGPGEGVSDGEKKQYTKEDVENLLTEKIKGFFTEDQINGLTTMITVIAIIVIVTFAMWAWLIVKMILKLFAKNPMIRLWLPIWFGNIPFTLLYAVPAALGYCLTHIASAPAFITDALTSALPADAYNTLTVASNSLRISVSSCTLASAILTVVFAVYSVIYWIFRNKIKREI